MTGMTRGSPVELDSVTQSLSNMKTSARTLSSDLNTVSSPTNESFKTEVSADVVDQGFNVLNRPRRSIENGFSSARSSVSSKQSEKNFGDAAEYNEGCSNEVPSTENGDYQAEYHNGDNQDASYQENYNHGYGQNQEGYDNGQYQEGYDNGQYQEGYDNGQYQEGYDNGQYQEGYDNGQYQEGYDNGDYQGGYDQNQGAYNNEEYSGGDEYHQNAVNQDDAWDDGPSAPQNSNYQSNSRSGDSPKSCFKCNETGHFARECPNGDTRSCYKCKGSGHISRDCPEGSDNKGCFKCHEEGHMARDCPNGDVRGSRDGGQQRGSRACYKCNEEGHMARDCPNGDGTDAGQQRGPRGCFKCKQEGHKAADCTNEAAPEDPEKPPKATYEPVEVEADSLFDTGIDAGTNFDAIRNSSVEVSGRNNSYAPINSFEDADLSQEILENIKKCRYTQPTKIQQHCIPLIKEKRDIMACAQTGSGKTAAFIVPILDHILKTGKEFEFAPHVPSPTVLVITPTRELANQIYTEARKFSTGTFIKCLSMYGGVAVSYERSRARPGYHVLIATPGRLLDNLERRKLDFSKIEFVVLDEADRMLDMGFKDPISKIFDHSSMPQQRQTLMFSATFPREIQKLARDYLNDYLFVTVGVVGAANSDVKQVVVQVDYNDKKPHLKAAVLEEIDNDASCKILVFVESKRSADFLALFLSSVDISCSSIHGDRSQQQREEALRDFKKGKINVLVATSVASRGLDIKGVSQVINFDMPKEIDDYIHRIGRTGRVGNRGLSISYFDPAKDTNIREDLKKTLEDSGQEIPEFLNEMEYGGGRCSSANVGSYRNNSVAPPVAAAPAAIDDDDW